jgi:DNA-binding PadR family transcriptional regulator
MATPLTPAVMHILLALVGGERHGYGILKEVLRQTSDEVRLGPGTIYGTLQRLMESGWVEESEGPSRQKTSGAARSSTSPATREDARKYYRITRAGREALKGEVDRLDVLLRAAREHHIVPRSVRG